MVRLSIKPGDQTDITESQSLVNKTGLAKRLVPTKAFSIFIKFKTD